MTLPEPSYVDVDSTRTCYYEAGSGPAMLLIHGGSFDYRLGIAADDWDSIFGRLAERYHVVAVDKLGAGRTDGPRRREQHTMSAVIAHLHGVVDALGFTDYITVGHSRGALPAARLALDDPERVRALVVLDSNTLPRDDPDSPPSPYFPPGTIVPSEQLVAERLTQAFDDPTAAHPAAYLARKLATYPPGPPQHAGRPLTAERLRRVLAAERDVFLPDLRQVKSETMDEIAESGFRQPALIIWGLGDRSAPIELGFELFRTAGRSSMHVEMHTFNSGRHLIQVEYPDRVAAVMDEFLSRALAPLPIAGPMP